MTSQLDRLLAIMARLRDPETGCEWDRAQTFATIAPYTLEEAYEVADAIERGNLDELRGELGDLLLQVVFHARMAEEAGLFDFEEVARSISEKMESRHPHIFGGSSGSPGWEALKEAERRTAGSTGTMDGIGASLPALLRAEKLQRRAARSGFDWPDATGPADKLREEMDELSQAEPGQRAEEAGDLLFAAANLVRAHKIGPEDALRAANRKFERRFRSMETLAGGPERFSALTLNEQEALWQQVKQAERSAGSK